MDRCRSARSLEDLVEVGVLSKITPELRAVVERYPVSITPSMLELINPRDNADPIAAQFVPSEKELIERSEELSDPIGDTVHTPVDGIVHRYPDRVLLQLLHTCPVYCRFCFRRERIGCHDAMLSPEKVKKALAYIREHKEIWEVVFSGGDPFLLSDRRLAEAVAELNEMEHVKILRFHTRLPVVDPSRITKELVISLLGRCSVYVFLHCNHERELTPAARAACGRLINAGIPLLSQSVLLRGVNDTPESLGALMRAFVETRVIPHYLHHGDLARGTGHFRVSIEEGQALLHSMRGNMSGLCQPTYILDIPGGYGKIPIGPVFATSKEKLWQVEDFHGCTHDYRE